MENQKYSQEEIDRFWQGFLKETNRDEVTKYLEVDYYFIT